MALGVIRTPPTDAAAAAPGRAAAELAALIAEFRPDVVAVEQVFFQVNVRTAMSVGQASGLALAEAAAAGCEVAQYTPNQVKDAVAGYGAAPTRRRCSRWCRSASASPRRRSRPTPPTPRRWRCATWRSAPMRARIADAARTRRPAVIGSLRGAVLERWGDGAVLLEVGGVGYLVTVTPRTLAELEPTSTGVPLRAPPHPRGRPDALRLPRAATSGRRSRC